MSGVPLGAIGVSGAPSRATLQRQLSELTLPPRTTALLRTDAETQPGLVSGVASRGAPVTAAIANALRTVVEQLASGSTDSISYQRAVSRLVGLGPGLTPTGDDLLIALLATSRLLSRGSHGLLSCGAAEALRTAVASLPTGLTTEVGEHLLSASVAGRFPLPLAAFVTALGDPYADRVTRGALAQRLAETGAHSGADWFAGVVALAQACVGQGGQACPSA
jgi:hypothetical protein